jgi:hypothetical protein
LITYWPKVGNFAAYTFVDLQKLQFFCFFFCLDAKETKNQGQPDRSARLSSQRGKSRFIFMLIPKKITSLF